MYLLIYLALLNMVPSTLLDFDWLKLIRHMHEIFSIIGRIQTDPNINLPEIKVLLPQEPWLMMRSLFWRPDSEIFYSKLQIYSNPAVDVKEETEKEQHVIFLVKIDLEFGIMEKVIRNNDIILPLKNMIDSSWRIQKSQPNYKKFKKTSQYWIENQYN